MCQNFESLGVTVAGGFAQYVSAYVQYLQSPQRFTVYLSKWIMKTSLASGVLALRDRQTVT